MEGPLMRLPRHARGLKLARIGVFIMLAQLVLGLVMSVKAFGATSTDGAEDAFKWIQYFLWANMGATGAMFVGSVLAIPDFRAARLPLGMVLFGAACFATATVALWWSHHVISNFMHVALDPDSTAADVEAAIENFGSLKIAVVVKDLSYTIGLITIVRTVRQAAVANEQLALRDAASHLTGLIVLMLISDVFYQLTYGLGSGASIVPFLGFAVSLGVVVYWIYCHLRLQRFLENAAYFVNEPHHLPSARLVNPGTVETDAPTPRPSQRSMPRPSAPSIPNATPSAPVIVVAPELRAAPVPRAETSPEGEAAEPPRFLR
ncbi:MAG: hypothetical protein IPQ07_27275 [Myxococcales bacterium]|nr:hypothetical protein [Myxococcales bacterium]